MVVHDFNILQTGRHPSEIQLPLVNGAYAVLAAAVFLQNLHAVLRRYLQVTQNGHPVKHGQLAHGFSFDVGPSLDTPVSHKF